MKAKNIAVLVSNKGTGSNLQAIIDARDSGTLKVNIRLVVSDQPGVGGIQRAIDNKIPHTILKFQRPKDKKNLSSKRNLYSKKLANLLNEKNIHVAILAGFSTILSPSYLKTFKGITLNIHPGWIPDRADEPGQFPDGTQAPWNRGLLTDNAVANFLSLKFAASSLHQITSEVDFGPVYKRVIVPKMADDDVDSLYSRLKKAEHQGMISVLKKL